MYNENTLSHNISNKKIWPTEAYLNFLGDHLSIISFLETLTFKNIYKSTMYWFINSGRMISNMQCEFKLFKMILSGNWILWLVLINPTLVTYILHLYSFTDDIRDTDRSSHLNCHCYSVFILYPKQWSKFSQKLVENSLEKQQTANRKLAIKVIIM